MNPSLVDRRLGTQLWIEREDSEERINALVSRAASLGFGQIRVFLMWPWIQADGPDDWDWRIWDQVFDACERYGVQVKATLTSNSGPWWLGTPSVLHSATLTLHEGWRPHQGNYIRAAVSRYAQHPALGQWILWNEPGYPHEPSPEVARPVDAHREWESLLRDTYPTIEVLNRRWRTGYGDFTDVPFLEGIVHPAHRDWYWHSWAPYRDDAVLRARLIETELDWVASIVREGDQETPLCVNPNKLLNNHAASGLRVERMASMVNTLGASFHAPWVFTSFAEVDDHPGLVVQGLRLIQQTCGSHTSEVTEAQSGNTFYAGVDPIGVGFSEIAATYLAPLVAGADSVTGWCFNTRGDDFEAGEWGLLNDDDSVSERAAAIPRVRECLEVLDHRLGRWHPQPMVAGVLVSPTSQAHQFALGENTHTPVASDSDMGIQATAVAAVELERLGIPTTLIDSNGRGWNELRAIVAIHQNALSESELNRLLDAAKRGATVLLDATSAQFTEDSVLYRPWPGIWAGQTGLISRGLDTASDGSGSFSLTEFGHATGSLVGIRTQIQASDDWVPLPRFAWADTGSPVLIERSWGSGRLIYSTAALAPSLRRGDVHRRQVSLILAEVLAGSGGVVKPISPKTSIVSLESDQGGRGWAVFAPPRNRRSGHPFHVSLPAGHYIDAWSGDQIRLSSRSTLERHDEHGIAVLISESA